MNKTEAIVVCVVIVAATLASIFGNLSPEALTGLLGLALGYGAKGTVASIPPIKDNGGSSG
jgi:small-conductance mechanosensitive channel